MKGKRKEKKELGLTKDEIEKTKVLDREKRNFTRSQKLKELTFEQKAELIAQFANYGRPKDILKYVKEKFGIPLKRESLYSFAKVHKEQIRLKRATDMADLDDIPLKHRKVRVVKLSRYIQRLELSNDLLGAASLIRHIRDEVGDGAKDLGGALSRISGPTTQININNLPDNSIIKMVMSMPEGLQKQAIISGLDELTKALETGEIIPIEKEG